MNWVKIFSKVEKEYNQEAYIKATEYFDEFEKVLSPLESKLGNFISEIMEEYDNLDEISHEVSETIMSVYAEGREVMNQIEEYYRTYSLELNREIRIKTQELCKNIMPYITSEREFNLMKKRLMVCLNQTSKKLSSLLDELFEGAVWFYKKFIGHLKDLVLDAGKRYFGGLKSFSVEEGDNSDSLSGQEIRKIFDYKEMETLAKENNYVYKWSSGSHRIYENKDTNKIVVIPSHDLGLGLSVKIQKQILCG